MTTDDILKAGYYQGNNISSLVAKMMIVRDDEVVAEDYPKADDNEQVREQKTARIRAKHQTCSNRLEKLREHILSPGHKYFENLLWEKLKEIDQELIWTALAEDNKTEIINLRIRRQAIMEFVELYKEIEPAIVMMKSLLESIDKGELQPVNLNEEN